MATLQTEITNAFEEIASTSSSTPTKKAVYDVFINHRGIDVKKTLASSIYNTLHRMGFRVFLDEEELELGDNIPAEIEDAMRTSFLHIAIFSPNYAQSPWCLAELSYMLKTGTRIIPVFYDVDPSDLRWAAKEKGTYADAFSEHEAKNYYSPEKLKDWKMALQQVSNRSGSILKKDENCFAKCGKLDELPSFAKLVSLETLRAGDTTWKMAAIQSWEHMERLRRVEFKLAACDISAIEHCLRTIKKLPSKTMVWGRTEHDVDSLLKLFTFDTDFSLVDSRLNAKPSYDMVRLKVSRGVLPTRQLCSVLL